MNCFRQDRAIAAYGLDVMGKSDCIRFNIVLSTTSICVILIFARLFLYDHYAMGCLTNSPGIS